MPPARHPLVRLQVFSLACGLIAAGYELSLLEPAPLLVLGLLLGPPVAVASWIAVDTRYPHAANVVDARWLIYLVWQRAIP